MTLSVEELNVLNVHELRAMAREIGVRAPTTKKQQELIEEILKIQSGMLQPHTTNMGRPVKSGIRADILKSTITLAKNNYVHIDLKDVDVKYEDCQKIQVISDNDIVECAGIVRKINGKFYIQNYLGKCKYIILLEEQIVKNNLQEGDYIKGTAKLSDKVFGDLISVEQKNFAHTNSLLKAKEVKVVNLKNDDEIYSFIKNDNKINKIVLEIECNKNLTELFDNCVVISTKECEDVKVSYNALIDCKNFIENLCKQDGNFIVYVNNTEYIYSILKIYYNYIKFDQDLNAGQYFKEILSMVANSKNGNIILFEKEKCKRSSYLDIIINKYCDLSNK